MDLNEFDEHNDIFDIKTFLAPSPNSSNKAIQIKVDFLNGKTTVFPYELKRVLSDALSKGGINHLWQEREGGHALPCRVLQDGKPWRKGKIIIKVEFVEDEEPLLPENELDTLR